MPSSLYMPLVMARKCLQCYQWFSRYVRVSLWVFVFANFVCLFQVVVMWAVPGPPQVRKPPQCSVSVLVVERKGLANVSTTSCVLRHMVHVYHISN